MGLTPRQLLMLLTASLDNSDTISDIASERTGLVPSSARTGSRFGSEYAASETAFGDGDAASVRTSTTFSASMGGPQRGFRMSTLKEERTHGPSGWRGPSDSVV